MLFDPLYLLLTLPAILLAGWAQLRVKTAYAEADNIRGSCGLTGAQTAASIMRSNGITDVGIEQVEGHLSDHYDPRAKVLRLSPAVFSGRSLAALGIAAHEAGHALQDANHYLPLKFRNGIVPLAAIGSNVAFGLFVLGLTMQATGMILLAIGLFSAAVLFQLINLPVEYDASRRAKALLLSNGLISNDEHATVDRVLSAAALTYVAATLSSILTLIYFLMRSGLLGERRNE